MVGSMKKIAIIGSICKDITEINNEIIIVDDRERGIIISNVNDKIIDLTKELTFIAPESRSERRLRIRNNKRI